MVPSARSESRSASFAAVSPSTPGNALKMPPGDLPVTIAQVANVTRSAASRGGTSEPSASATACWLSTCAAAAAADNRPPFLSGPPGFVGGGGMLGPAGLLGAGGTGTSA
jgi:hypothetical protein